MITNLFYTARLSFTFAKEMICKTLALITGLLLFGGCSSGLSDPQTIREGPHKSRALSLLQRNPKDDASAFCRVGGVGYVMTNGGLRMPIGVRVISGFDTRDFESLKPFAPILYSQIYPLLEDVENPLTMRHYTGEIPLSKERQFYHKVRSSYAKKFNRHMKSLAKY